MGYLPCAYLNYQLLDDCLVDNATQIKWNKSFDNDVTNRTTKVLGPLCNTQSHISQPCPYGIRKKTEKLDFEREREGEERDRKRKEKRGWNFS